MIMVLVAACGRTPVGPDGVLLVQVVDEGDESVVAAHVEIRAVNGTKVIAEGRTDGTGIVALPFPGVGEYVLHAATDVRCCRREGTLDTAVTEPDELVVIRARTGPCPTWVPPSCG